MNIASVPHTLWHLYLDNLVYYKPGSWVDSAASTCRVLAFMTILPFILLTLLVSRRMTYRPPSRVFVVLDADIQPGYV